LFELGGIYGDLTQTYVAPLANLVDVDNDELVLTRDRVLNPWIFSCPIQISFIAARKKHPMMRACIDAVVRNVQGRYYGQGPFHITGPSLFGEVLAAYGYPCSLRFREGGGWLYDIQTNTRVIKTKLDAHHTILNKRKKTRSSYSKAWRTRDVYY
jgi:hypothetical protein